MYYSGHSHNCSFLYPNPSIGNSSSEKTLNLNDIKIKRVSFEPIKTKSINAKNFVDLACVNQAHGLKMTMSIQDGKLVLIAAKNRGFIRNLYHQCTKREYKIVGAKVRHSRYKGTLDWSNNDIVFKRLWVDRQQSLCAEVNYQNQSHYVLLKLKSRPFNQTLNKDGSECNFPLSVSINSLESNDIKYAPTSGSVEIQLKSGKDAKVTFDERLVTLKLGGSIKHLTLPISRDEKIEDIKPCGECLQVAISKKTDKKSRILYINIHSLTLNGECLPIISSSPPIAFFHSACNNSEHFINANPFVGCKPLHIGNNHLPLNRFIDSIKHRFASGRRKWHAKGKWAAILSLTKALDPGIQSLVALGHSRYHASKINEELQCKVDKLRQELADIKTLSGYWGNDISLLRSVNIATLRLKPNKSEVVGSDNKIIEQIELATDKLKLINPLFSYDENVGSHPMATWFNKQKDRIEQLQSRIEMSDYNGFFNNQSKLVKLDDLKNVLASLSKAKESPIKAKEFDLLCAFVERTILNVHVLLSSNSASGYGSALNMKLYNEAEGELTKAITRQHFGSTAWRATEKTFRHLGYSLNNKHTSLGKLWSQMNSPRKPDDNLANQIAAQMSAMPEGDTLTFTTREGAEVFFGYAQFGLPLIGGWFAAVLPAYEKEYSTCLESLGNGETKLNFSREKVKSVTGVIGTGQGLEDLAQLVKHAKGSVVTIMPFEGNVILQVAEQSKHDSSFTIKNEGVSDTLVNLLKIKPASSEEPTVGELTNMQCNSEHTYTVKCKVEVNSEWRVQNGVSVSPSIYMVAPRYSVGISAVAEVARVQKSETKIGITSSFEATTELGVTASISHSTTSKVMPIFISTTDGFGVPLPISDAEKTFVEQQLRHTDIFDKKGTELGSALENTVDDQLQSISPEQKLNKLKEWVSQQSQVSRTNKNQINNHIEILIQALNKGFHQVEKSIDAGDIGQVNIDYQPSSTLKFRLVDGLKKRINLPPKHSTSLEQLLVDYKSGPGLLAAIRSSSQSQSQSENLGKASAVTAHLDYQIPKEQLQYLAQLFEWQIRSTLTNGTSNQIKQVIRRFAKILSRSDNSDRGIYRLSNIRFIRTSYVKQRPFNMLPLITVTNQGKIELSESLGEIEFCYKHNSKNPPSAHKVEKISTENKSQYVSRKNIPHNIVNKLDPSLLSAPMKYYTTHRIDPIQD